MNSNDLDFIHDDISLLLVKKKRMEITLSYLTRVKPKNWKLRQKKLTYDIKSLDDSLYKAYIKLDNIFSDES